MGSVISQIVAEIQNVDQMYLRRGPDGFRSDPKSLRDARETELSGHKTICLLYGLQ